MPALKQMNWIVNGSNRSKISGFFFIVSLIILVGSGTYSMYPVWINVVCVVFLIFLFYVLLETNLTGTFFSCLFIGNLFIFGNEFGGVYNLAAFMALAIYFMLHRTSRFDNVTIHPAAVQYGIIVLFVAHLVSVIFGNSFDWLSQLRAVVTFGAVLLVFYECSKIGTLQMKLADFVFMLCLSFLYLFFVSFNQKFEIIAIDFPFFPMISSEIEVKLGMVRIGSTLHNFESYAEFSFSVIALLIPGLLSGTLFKFKKSLFVICLITVFAAFVAIVWSGTRSSMILLPVLIVLVLIIMRGRIKRSVFVFLLLMFGSLFILNTHYDLVDFSAFLARSETLSIKDFSFMKIATGEEINRGPVFSYAIDQVVNANGVVGKGYFMTSDHYRQVHFESEVLEEGVADFHNLYMSSYVLWGLAGLVGIMIIFISPLIVGWRIYRRSARNADFKIDIILGFVLMFAFFIVNQLKIQFIRDINYVMLMFLLLSYFNALNTSKRADFVTC